MKKIISLVLIAIICAFCLCGCGGNSEQFTVICNDGTVEKISRKELENLRENELTFQQKYSGAHISGKGEIYSIEADGWKSDGTISTVSIEIGSFTTKLWYVPADYAAGYEVGDEIEVSGTIKSQMDGFAYIYADDFYD